MRPEERAALRKAKIKSRDAYSVEERQLRSQQISEQILASPEFRQARTILLYKGIRGEVRLDQIEQAVQFMPEKRLAYPLCVSTTEMIALYPVAADAWGKGYCGILEPVRERSIEIAPEEIDLVICPCTVFDEAGGRMGMGAGFYDRYLEQCTHAVVAAAAFECQKTDRVPLEPWDKTMEIVFTEQTVYRQKVDH